ncbi:MAG: IS66 family insertion sequence element accessory protein TnpB, partial [Bacteroidales bacterium]|nr:IS66 family insertion sequence element accessory protein TnpB [Bacteroidales bacterium]
MLTVSNEYGIYLYSDKVDMRKGIDGLCGIVRSQMGLSPFKSKSIFVFGGKNCKRRFRPRPRRSACLVHIRRGMVDALGENHDEAMWFIDEIGKIFSVEYHCKKMGMSANERLV